jgi:hypothetical protein
MHTSVPAQKLQTLTVMMVLVSQDTFQVHGSASSKHLRKMVKVIFAGPR